MEEELFLPRSLNGKQFPESFSFSTHYSRYGFLFNLNDQSIGELFQEFDVSGDDELDYKEFRMFAMACIGSLNISIGF